MNQTLNPHQLDLERLARLQHQMQQQDVEALLLYDPTNIRYATGSSNMQVYGLHNPCRYALVPSEGKAVMFEFAGCEHLLADKPAIGDIRNAVAWYHFIVGNRVEEKANQWADEITDLLPGRRLAVDRLDPVGMAALHQRGIQVSDGQPVINHARMIKTPQEMIAMRAAIANCEKGMALMHQNLTPGITEQKLWSYLHQANIEQGGEWIETRLLTSGPNTNPWYQECSAREIENGDLVSFDTDLIGAHGYSADISRSWVTGDRRPTSEQRALYSAAYEQVARNIERFRPGVSYREIAEKSWSLPERFAERTNSAIAHGIGLCNEYPLIVAPHLWEDGGIDGHLEAGMVLCVESFAGEVGGREGVKLEQQILVTENGPELLSTYPLEESML